MSYKPIQATSSGGVAVTSLMAKRGINKRDLQQMLGVEFALVIENYIITAEGGLEKRKGKSLQADTSSNKGVTMFSKWTDNLYLFGYGDTKLAAFDKSTKVVTDIKIDFLDNVTGGEKYSDGYFFVASPKDKIGRVTRTLNYDGQTGDFATGLVVTGATSGATGVILEDNDAGVAGFLTLGNIIGTFIDTEDITDTATGAAKADGTVSYTYNEITDAPKARVIKVIGTRLHAGDLEEDRTKVRYSAVDAGTNPPFNGWTKGTSATDAGEINYRNAGIVKCISNLANNIIVGYEDGKMAFQINTMEVGGVATKTDDIIYSVLDFGMDVSLQTKEGVFYANNNGLYQLVSIGQENVKFSEQSQLVSNLLGNKYFDDITLDNASLVKDDRTNTLLLSCADDSGTNNKIIAYNTSLKSFSTFTGWNLNKMFNDEGVLYGGGSSEGKLYKLFDGYDDDGSDIWTKFEQEINFGQLWTAKEMNGQYLQGLLSASTILDIIFDIYDKTGAKIEDKLKLRWSADTAIATGTGYGTSAWGKSSWGRGARKSGVVESFNGLRGRIKNFQRLIIKITGNDKIPHTINWLSLDVKEKTNIRKRKIIKLT